MMGKAITKQSRFQDYFIDFFAILLRLQYQLSKHKDLEFTRKYFGFTWYIPWIARGFCHWKLFSEQRLIQRLLKEANTEQIYFLGGFGGRICY